MVRSMITNAILDITYCIDTLLYVMDILNRVLTKYIDTLHVGFKHYYG